MTIGKMLFLGLCILAKATGALAVERTAQKAAAEASRQSAKLTAGSIVYAARAGASLNTDLLKGGGSDDTAMLQRLLDRAADGKGVHLIVDGPALISGLTVHSRTTIECMAGGGFYLKDGSKRSIIRNANRSRDARIDEHIEIRGCFIDGNRKGQPRSLGPTGFFAYVQEPDKTFRSGLQFFGVQYLTIENVTLRNVHGFHSWIGNAKFVDMRNVTIDTAIPAFPDRASLAEQKEWTHKHWSNDDGMHFNGPIQYLTIDGAKIRTWDDGISFTANDYGVDDMTVSNEMGPYVGQGPITDVNISNVMFMDSHRGIRMLSGDQRIDRISVQNVTGTNRQRFAVISHLDQPGRGNFGSITFSNVNVASVPHPALRELFFDPSKKDQAESGVLREEGELPFFGLNASIENLQLNQIATHAIDSRPVIFVGPDAAIGMLSGNLSIHDPHARAVPLKIMGRIQRLKLSLDWAGSTPIGYEAGTIPQTDSSLLSEETRAQLKHGLEGVQELFAAEKSCPSMEGLDRQDMAANRQCRAEAFYRTAVYNEMGSYIGQCPTHLLAL